ncbi:MAG: reverse transcriptase [Candidatus Lokiarchaeota archaeon]|nr:reverse transcriptase [Candidatus Lokiarchaeota archaeon]
MTKTIIDVDHEKARKFFLDKGSYLTVDLPQYFDFSTIIEDLSDHIRENELTLEQICKAKAFEEVNHILFSNKDGKYAWRKLQIIHPVLYVALVHKITEKENWELIVKRIRDLHANPSIKCASLPIFVSALDTQKARQITYWLHNVEEESIKLALDFEYLFHTDITDCYGAIYTHSIPWAIHTKETAKEKRRDESLIGNIIDQILQSMSYGQTNGIPQGSILMDFLAEFVLAYGDQKLSQKISDLGIREEDYRIIRYRDDYRIFVREPQKGEEIMKALSEILASIGMKLNPSKTQVRSDVITGAIKPEKLYYLQFPIPHKVKSRELKRELLIALQVSEKFPNTGATTKRLTKLLELYDDENKYPIDEISILISIAVDSPMSIPVVTAFISKLIKLVDKDKKKELYDKIMRKIKLLPNSSLLEIWIQRMLIKSEYENNYEEKLCLLAAGKDSDLFNNEWLPTGDLKGKVEQNIVDRDIIDSLDEVISKEEIELFKTPHYS